MSRQETFLYFLDDNEVFIRIIYSAKKSTLGKKIERQNYFDSMMEKRELIQEKTPEINYEGMTTKEKRNAKLEKAMSKKIKNFFVWKNYFHGKPLVLQNIKKHFIEDGKKVCIQYCCPNNPLLEKANYCAKQISLM